MQLIMEPESVADVKPMTKMVDTEPIIQEKLSNGVEAITNGIDSNEASESEFDLNKAWDEINDDQAKIVENGECNGANNEHVLQTKEQSDEEKQDAVFSQKSEENNLHETQNSEPKIDEVEDIIPKANVITHSDKGEPVPENANKTDEVVPENEKENTEIKNNQTTEVLTEDDKPSKSVEVPVVADANGVTNQSNDPKNNIEKTDVINEGVAYDACNTGEDMKVNGDINELEDIIDGNTHVQEEKSESADKAEKQIKDSEMPKSCDNEGSSEIEKEQADEIIPPKPSEVMEVDAKKTNDVQSPTDDESESENKSKLSETTEMNVNISQEAKAIASDAETKPEHTVDTASVPENITKTDTVTKDVSFEAMEVEESTSKILPETEVAKLNGNSVDASVKDVIVTETMEVDPLTSNNTVGDKALEATKKGLETIVVEANAKALETMDVDTEATSISGDVNKKTEIVSPSENDSQSETSEIAKDATQSEEDATTKFTSESIDETDRKLEVSQPEVISVNENADIPTEVTESKKIGAQKESAVLIEDVNEVMDSDDEKEAEKSKTAKADIKVQEINDCTEKPEEAKPRKRSFLGLANTLDILSDDEESESKVEGPKKTKISSDEGNCINLDDDKVPEVTEKARDEKCTSNTLDIISDDEDNEQKVEEPKKTDISADTDSNCINLDDDKAPEVTEKAKDGCKSISNTLDILSDDEESEQKVQESKKTDISDKDDTKCINLDGDKAPEGTDKSKNDKCISIEDDDDVMLIDEDTPKEVEKEKSAQENSEKEAEIKDSAPEEKKEEDSSKPVEVLSDSEKELSSPLKPVIDEKLDINEKPASPPKVNKPLIPENFLKKFKANVAEMTRDELEEFCLLKIVEAVIDRSNLSDISSKLKKMYTTVEEWKKKAVMLTKQNRDLSIVVNTVQEEHQKRAEGIVTPLKITRSVGMQVVMTDSANDKITARRKTIQTIQPVQPPQAQTRGGRAYTPRVAKQQPANPPNIPVPRLVPAPNNSPLKTTRQTAQQIKSTNIVKNSPPVQRVEKRSYTSMQSVTVDLTDDEPAPKQQATVPRNNPVRLVSPQQLLTPRAQINAANSPRKVFIPINAPNNLRPGQTIMIKPGGAGPRGPRGSMVRMSQAPVRMGRAPGQRHPAPLPEAPKQPQHNMWKALPPEPDLKISKVENGIVISWKIEGYQEDSYEEIASYQLYAYQETSSPPSTLLWKKIGDVKALPLPMACTLTQFMAGFKYYFAVRAVDVKSRIGPFSLPGSILLLNK